MNRHTFMAGVLICVLAGSAKAASYEVRGGYRDGLAGAIAFDAPTEHVSIGAILEYGENESVSLIGRVTKEWPHCVTPYIGAGFGLASEEVTETLTFYPQYRSGRSLLHTTDTHRDEGPVFEAVAGLRGLIRPGVAWLLEVSAQDREHEDGVGAQLGLRFRR